MWTRLLSPFRTMYQAAKSIARQAWHVIRSIIPFRGAAATEGMAQTAQALVHVDGIGKASPGGSPKHLVPASASLIEGRELDVPSSTRWVPALVLLGAGIAVAGAVVATIEFSPNSEVPPEDEPPECCDTRPSTDCPHVAADASPRPPPGASTPSARLDWLMRPVLISIILLAQGWSADLDLTPRNDGPCVEDVWSVPRPSAETTGVHTRAFASLQAVGPEDQVLEEAGLTTGVSLVEPPNLPMASCPCWIIDCLGPPPLPLPEASQRTTLQDRTGETPSPSSRSDSTAPAALKPKWDATTRCLSVGDIVVREYKRKAPNQIAILEAFEKAGWPARIDTPLCEDGNKGKYKDPKLNYTIRDLKRRINPKLLNFEADGTGTGIRYRLLPAD